MDRRSALARLAIAGTAFGAASSIATSTAFADGGSIRCRPTIPATGSVTWAITAVPANRVEMSVAPGSFAAVPCPCRTPTTSLVEYRYTLDSASAALGIYSSGGALIGNTWLATNNPAPVVQLTAGGPLPSPMTYTIRWTVRWKCNGAFGPAWRCRSWIATVSFTSGPPTATITAQSESSPGTPCDAPPL